METEFVDNTYRAPGGFAFLDDYLRDANAFDGGTIFQVYPICVHLLTVP